MVSKTKQTQERRRLRDRRTGAARKRRLRNKGTTPPFPLDPAE